MTEPLNHIVVVNHALRASNEDVAFWAEACRLQLKEVAAAWGLPAPGVFFIGPRAEVPSGEAAVIGVVDNDANASSAGYHSVVGRLAFGLVDMGDSAIPSRTMSHEAIEMLVNPWLDRWVPGPEDRLYAVEACDPVQRSDYTIATTVLGITRDVVVSNWVTPAWFGLEKGTRMDRLTRLLSPWSLELGGYQIAQEDGHLVHLGDRICAEDKPVLSRTARTGAAHHR